MTKLTQGEIIARQRKALGLSQNALAKRLGKSHSMIWGTERGRTKISSPETIEATAEALEVSADDLYAGASLIPPDIEQSVRALDAGELGELRELLAIMRSGSSLRDRLLGREAISAAEIALWGRDNSDARATAETAIRAALEAALGPE